MKPTQGKCKDCKFYQDWFCLQLYLYVEEWWTGCVMWTAKKEKVKEGK